MRGRAGAPAGRLGFEGSSDAFSADERAKRICLAGRPQGVFASERLSGGVGEEPLRPIHDQVRQIDPVNDVHAGLAARGADAVRDAGLRG